MAEIKRKLATIRTIKSVEPIEGADLIVKLTFEGMGWVVVTNKDTNPKVGDKRVYFEIDSVLPEVPLFEFMRPYHFRVKTIKLKGQVSQGLSIPLDEIRLAYGKVVTHEAGTGANGLNTEPQWKVPLDAKDGDDLTEVLDVRKYELPESVMIGGDVAGPFPSFISKTDEERAQNLDNIEEILATKDLVATTKVDGTSMTAYWFVASAGVCSRNLELKDTGTTLWKLAHKHGLPERLEAYSKLHNDKNIAVQGEVAGPGIQSNRAKLREVGFYIFTVQDIDVGERLSPKAQADFILELNSLCTDQGFAPLVSVPLLGIYPAGTFKTLVDLEDFSNGPTGLTDVAKADQQVAREGVVFRSTDGTVSFKFISPKYLLKHDL